MKPKQKIKTVSRHSVQCFVIPILNVGTQLSNIAFNLKQRTDLPKEILASCDHCQREWDEAMRNVPGWMRT